MGCAARFVRGARPFFGNFWICCCWFVSVRYCGAVALALSCQRCCTWRAWPPARKTGSSALTAQGRTLKQGHCTVDNVAVSIMNWLTARVYSLNEKLLLWCSLVAPTTCVPRQSPGTQGCFARHSLPGGSRGNFCMGVRIVAPATA